ncbi:MAG: DinB family protein [Candidatus Cyclobacteriaceae bacterium M2_1C_046]
MKKHFLELFEYNHWANIRMLAVLEDENVDDKELLKLFSHLISSQIIWLHRIKDMPTSPFPLWEKYKLRELKSMVYESSGNWINYVREEHRGETFEEMIFYKNSEGVKFETTIRHIITHVINHSTYHRAQMAIRLRNFDITPPVTDFIAYSREKI